MFARSARALGQSLRAAATTTSTSGSATTTATTAAWRPAAVASVAHESRATAIGAARGHLASRWNSAPRAGSQTIRRAFAAEAAEEAANEPTALTRVLETIATIATVAGVVVAGAVSSNFYAQTTNELDASIKAGTHVPFVLRGTPLEDPVDQGYHALLEFRRWADGQKHVYLDPISDKLLPDHPVGIPSLPRIFVRFRYISWSTSASLILHRPTSYLPRRAPTSYIARVMT